MSANPYKRQSDDAESSMHTWDVATLVPAPIHSAACRIRWAARVACARLRVKMAWQHRECMRHRVTQAEFAKLTNDLDRARRVLAKLEGREP